LSSLDVFKIYDITKNRGKY